MTPPRIHRRPQARRDLVDHALYISEENLDAAERFLDAAEETFTLLTTQPEMGSPREFKNPRLAGLRMWPVKGFHRYLIFYRPTGDGIEIIRILRGEQDIAAIFEDEE